MCFDYAEYAQFGGGHQPTAVRQGTSSGGDGELGSDARREPVSGASFLLKLPLSMAISLRSVRFFSSKKSTVQRYLKRQMTDEFAVKAREHSFRARSAFKLLEIDEKFKFLKPGSTVVDVGCAPGSWSQVVVEKCGLDKPSSSNSGGFLLGVDLQVVLPVPGAKILSMSDVTKPEVQEEMRRLLGGREVDVLLSDMAPNPTGDSATDHLRLLDLCRTVFHLFHTPSSSSAPSPPPVFSLSPQGVYLCKIWDGVGRKAFIQELHQRFRHVRCVKPTACRDNSAEMYLYCSMK